MANESSGVCRVAAKDKSVFGRLVKIMNYKDDEFFVSRCRGFRASGDCRIDEESGLFVQDFLVSAAWNCGRLFDTDEKRDELIVLGYEKDENGHEDFERPVYGTAYLTNLAEIAKRLDFGMELWAAEFGTELSEHITLDHDGEWCCEVGDASLEYPDGEDGEPDYDAEPEEVYGDECYGDFMDADEIYGM